MKNLYIIARANVNIGPAQQPSPDLNLRRIELQAAQNTAAKIGKKIS